MDFDDAKENIQPLAAGRNASILQAALHPESQQELQQQRRHYEDAIKNYKGDDLLEPWFEYIYWIEQSYPSGGKESGLEEVLLKCLTKFENDVRYHQDRRMIKLYIKYIDTHENPQECYQQLYSQGIGTMVADLYICWAYYYDLSGNFRKADQIFRLGIDCRAQPLEELQEAHQHFGFTMSQRILYDDDNSKQKYQSTLQEKRHALTSLKSHKKKVGSVRTGAAVKSFVPGKIQVNSANTSSRHCNINVRVFEDENQDPNAIPPSEPAPDTSRSVVKTILDSARKQENVKEPGPWNKPHDKKKGKLFASESHTDLGFEILEDDDDLQPIKGKINYGKPFVFYEGFVARNQPQEEWNLPVTLENVLISGSYPSYDKCLLYPQPNMEYSLEELGGYYWYKRRNIENNFTKKYDLIWKNNFNFRMYPNFARKNDPIIEKPIIRNFDPSEANVSGKSKLVFDPKLCYPSVEEEELQFEEIMFHRWKNGERKLKYGGNETIAMLEEMEETICLPKDAARRKSFFPTRKSLAPSQFAKLPPNSDATEEEQETPKTSFARRSVIMKTPKKADQVESKASIQVYEDESNDSAFEFKPPAAPPVKQQKLAFQIYEEEENNYEANDTCSTQVFNCFLKAQSVSTPNAPAPIMKPCIGERQPKNLNFSGIENAPIPVNPSSIATFSPPEYNDAGLTLQCKQLSTIMETSEQATGNTGSTKSYSGEVLLMKSLRLDDEIPAVRQHFEISRLEQREDTVPMMPAVKIFEEKTETVPKILFAKAGNFSRLEDREDTTPSIKPVKFQEDKTETMTKIVLPHTKPVVNASHLDDEILEFFAKSPVKKTGAASAGFNVFTPPSVPEVVANKSIFTASAFMKFHDSPDAKQKCSYDSPELRAKRSSLMGMKKPSNLSFLPNFDDAIEMVKDGEKKKTLESSVLQNLSITSVGQKRQKVSDNSFLPEISRQHPKEDSFLPGFLKESASGSNLRRQQSKEDSFLPEFSKETAAEAVVQRQKPRDDSNLVDFPKGSRSPRQKSTEDSFLSGFPSVTVGANKPREDSFMSYLSSVGAPKAQQAAQDSFMKKFSSTEVCDKPKNVSDASSNSQRTASESLSKFSSPESDAKTKKTGKSPIDGDETSMKSVKITERSTTATAQGQSDAYMPNLSTNGGTQRYVGIEESFKNFNVTEDHLLPNLSTTVGAERKNVMTDSFMPNLSTDAAALKQNNSFGVTRGIKFQKPEDFAIEDFTIRGASRIPKPPVPGENLQKSSLVSTGVNQQNNSENKLKSTKLSFLGQQKPSEEDSFKFSSSFQSPQAPIKLSFLSSQPERLSQENKPQKLSKIPHLSHGPDTLKQQKPASQMNHSQPNSTISFLNSFRAPTEQPEQVQKFTIFEDSNCQKTIPSVPEAKQSDRFTIFEDSNCQGKNSLPQAVDVFSKHGDFFEDNIRTEAFAANLSMIKNSTWLPNHDPRQTQIHEQSLHIKDEINISNPSSDCEKSHGLSIFASVLQEQSTNLMPPPAVITKLVQLKPTKTPAVFCPPENCIEIPESDEDEDIDDLGKSIYYTKTPKTPKMTRHHWSPEADGPTPDVNDFIHRQVDLDHTQQVIDDYCLAEDVNPFNRSLMDAFLFQIDFTNYIEKLPTCDMAHTIKPLKKDSTVGINGKTFNVLKLIGEGAYGAVFCARETQSGRLFALKQERPANMWEYYICLELQSRLNSTDILPGFMNIECALIGNNAGILVSKFSRYGSLISVCNKIKKVTLKNLEQYVVMHIATQLLLIMDHLHASNIIHADVKADNFILMEKLVPGRKQPTIQLIDFGTSIDMDLFKKGQTFRYIHETESFKCVEMHEKRPWTYQLDLFGLAGVIHVLLFGKYMEIVKKPTGWTHKTHIPRYLNKSLWETIFHNLLNIDDCQTMPNLQNLRAQLKEEIAENDKAVCQKIVDFNRALDL